MAILAVSQYTAQHATKFHSYGYSSARVTGSLFDIRNGPDQGDAVFDCDWEGRLTLETALPLASGGLGLTTIPLGAILYASAPDTPAALAVGGANTILTSDGSVPGWTSGLTNTHIAVGAEILVSKLADGAPRQLLQTDAGGTVVEWTSDIDVPGTLDVAGITTLDDTLAVALTALVTGSIISGTAAPSLRREVNTSRLHMTGGISTDDGGSIDLYGSAHGSQANDIRLRADGANRLFYNHSALDWIMTGTLVVSGIITPTLGIELPSTQRMVLDGPGGQDYISSPSANLVRVTVGDVNRAEFTTLGLSVTGEIVTTGNVGISVSPISTTFLHLGAATAAKSSIVLPHGTAPSSPNNGDVWTTTAGFFARINGVTVGPFDASGGDITRVNITAGTGLTGDLDTTSGEHNQTINAIGTSNRISVSSGAIDISSGYVGQASITTVGTLAAGAVPASLVTAGSFASGTFTFDGTVNATTFVGALTGSISGNAATATVLATARDINGVAFDGSQDITITAAAGTLTGATLNSSVLASSLTSLGTIASLQATEAGAGIAPSSSTFLNVAAATTGLSSIRLVHGVAPSSPVDGDVWTTSAAGLFVRINGVTVGPLGTSGTGDITRVNITAGIGMDGSVNTATGDHVQTLDFLPSGLTALASGLAAGDELVVSDAGVAKRALVSGINLGIFNNDQNWTANVGDLTAVTVGTGLSVASSGGPIPNVTLNLTGLAAITLGSGDHLVVVDGTSNRKALLSTTNLGLFINDQGWTSSAGTVTNVTGGTGIDSTEGATPDITLDLNELATGGTPVGGDFFVYVDGTLTRKIVISSVNLGAFSNNLGWTTNTGDITRVSVTTSTGLDGTLNTTSGNHIQTISLDLGELVEHTGALIGTDRLVGCIGGAGSDIFAESISGIQLGAFNNNLGWTSNTGDITRVNITAGNGLTGNVNTASGDHVQTINAVGTSNRISVSSGAINIHTSYVGQTTITTLGTIATGAVPAAFVSPGSGVGIFGSDVGGDHDYAVTGKMGIGTTQVNGNYLVWMQYDPADRYMVLFQHNHDGSPLGIEILFAGSPAPDDNTQIFINCRDEDATRFKVFADGDVVTHDQGTLTSDETLKENIVPATSKLADVLALEIVSFNWNSVYHREGSETQTRKRIGYKARQIEGIFPGLVREYNLGPSGADGRPSTDRMTKTVKAGTIGAPILVKAFQEYVAQTDARLDALEGA